MEEHSEQKTRPHLWARVEKGRRWSARARYTRPLERRLTFGSDAA